MTKRQRLAIENPCFCTEDNLNPMFAMRHPSPLDQWCSMLTVNIGMDDNPFGDRTCWVCTISFWSRETGKPVPVRDWTVEQQVHAQYSANSVLVGVGEPRGSHQKVTRHNTTMSVIRCCTREEVLRIGERLRETQDAARARQ